MTFEETLRQRITSAAFGSLEKNVLKVVLGDIQLKAANSRVNDEVCHSIVKKLIKGNEESIGYLPESDQRRAKYLDENRILETLLPRYLTAKEIEVKLSELGLAEGLKSAKNDGQAVGMAMGSLKKANLFVEGDSVKQAVAALRKQ